MEFEYDYRLVHPGGAVRDIHTTGHPVVSPTGDLIEYMGTAIDITERKARGRRPTAGVRRHQSASGRTLKREHRAT